MLDLINALRNVYAAHHVIWTFWALRPLYCLFVQLLSPLIIHSHMMMIKRMKKYGHVSVIIRQKTFVVCVLNAFVEKNVHFFEFFILYHLDVYILLVWVFKGDSSILWSKLLQPKPLRNLKSETLNQKCLIFNLIMISKIMGNFFIIILLKLWRKIGVLHSKFQWFRKEFSSRDPF